jgi:hypothetical protein
MHSVDEMSNYLTLKEVVCPVTITEIKVLQM